MPIPLAGQLTRPSRGPAAVAPPAATQASTVSTACGRSNTHTTAQSTMTAAAASAMKNARRLKVNSNLFQKGESPKLLITFLLQMPSARNQTWLKTPRTWIADRKTDCLSTTRRLKKNSKSFTRKISISSLTEVTLRSSLSQASLTSPRVHSKV